MKRALIGGWALASLMGAAVVQAGRESRAIEGPPSPPPETKYDTRQQRRAAEKRARKMLKRAKR
jgi:hypothetical protein